MSKRIYADVSPDETRPGLSERFEVRFSAPVSGDWLLQLIDAALEKVSQGSHDLGNWESHKGLVCDHDLFCDDCGRVKCVYNMKHTRLYGYQCYCGSHSWSSK